MGTLAIARKTLADNSGFYGSIVRSEVGKKIEGEKGRGSDREEGIAFGFSSI